MHGFPWNTGLVLAFAFNIFAWKTVRIAAWGVGGVFFTFCIGGSLVMGGIFTIFTFPFFTF